MSQNEGFACKLLACPLDCKVDASSSDSSYLSESEFYLYQLVLGDACGLMIHQESFPQALGVSQSLSFLVF